MSEMYKKCWEYAKHVAEEVEAYYNGTTNKDGEKEGKIAMEVCIVNTIKRLKNGEGWQIMRRCRTGYDHVFPGVLLTLDEATKICNNNSFKIIAIGDYWECL